MSSLVESRLPPSSEHVRRTVGLHPIHAVPAAPVIRRTSTSPGPTIGRTGTTAYPASPVGAAAKRTFDLAVTALAITLLAPVMLVIVLLVVLSSPGSPVFGQIRIGRDGRAFRCWKFRSMYRDAEARLREDPQLWHDYVTNDFKLDCDEDPRVTPLGRMLRRSSLDELPQLFNVLVGQMSLVGPRPVVADELACYGPMVGAYLAVRPGMTGPWQVSGRNAVRYPERADLDADYVATWTFWADLRIIARTPVVLIRKIGVS